MSKTVNTTKFIAVYEAYFGEGGDPNTAVSDLRSSYEDQDSWDESYMQEVRIFEVGREGKPTITVAWAEESK